MENTCNPVDCTLHDLLGGKPEQCPNFMETVWVSDKGEKKLIRDCAPRRTMLMVQDLHNRQVGLQKAQEEQRNAFMRLGNHLIGMTQAIKDGRSSQRDYITPLPEG